MPCFINSWRSITLYVILLVQANAQQNLYEALILGLPTSWSPNSSLEIVMGIYGKYTKVVTIFSCVQILLGVLMFAIGIAFRVLVCSWITDASFGFWVGVLVFIGGIVGWCSATKQNYSFIGYYLGFNSFSIVLASLVIFCHSIASIHFMHQIDSVNTTLVNSSNATNMTTTTVTTTTTPLPTTPTTDPNSTTPNITTPTPTPTTSNVTSTSGPPGPKCYTHQTWSDYENGKRGMGLGASMIFLCFMEIIMSFLSLAFCWMATKIEPTGVPKRRATIQGTASEMIAASQRLEMDMPRRRRGRNASSNSYNTYARGSVDRNVASNTFNIYEDVYDMSSAAGASPMSNEYESIHETIPSNSVPVQTHEEPISDWYSTTHC